MLELIQDVYCLGLAEFGFSENSTMGSEVSGSVRVCLDLLIPTHRLERNVTIQLNTQDEVAIGISSVVSYIHINIVRT